jgi:hypothetical protein
MVVQSAAHSIPPGFILTLPPPDTLTVNTDVLTSSNCADTVAVLLTVHAPRPLHAPPHWTKDQFASPLADKATRVSASNPAEQMALHSSPGGLDVTVPLPSGLIRVVITKVGASLISAVAVTPGVKSATVLPE